MKELINLKAYPVRECLDVLLKDKTTKRNIIWATTTYYDNGEEYKDDCQITASKIYGLSSDKIRPRVLKTTGQQAERTKSHAEVFTPAWICNKMNNYCDDEWFERKNIFNHENDKSWKTTIKPIAFDEGKTWEDYIDSRRLEITCGEAPYLVSRYDVANGELIPVRNRIGMLDRKLRVINENVDDREEWFKWVIRAYQSVYGYEFQGDNLLIARINLLYTFIDYALDKWHKEPTVLEAKKIANIICWNIWQMDGLQDTVPIGAIKEEICMNSLFEEEQNFEENTDKSEKMNIYSKIYVWKNKNSINFNDFKGSVKSMKFDFVIGNPPYHDEMKDTSDTPIYNFFMDTAYRIATVAELITPARFLFNAGKTPKDWNKKMLTDEHLKVLYFEPDSAKVFSNTDIKGGVAITYRDTKKIFGAIQTFTTFTELNTILHKVQCCEDRSLSEWVFAPESYRFTKQLYIEHPEILKLTMTYKGKEVPLISKGHDYDLTSNIFEKLYGKIFFKNIKNGIGIFGRMNNERIILYTKPIYIAAHTNLNKYKVFFPKANGAGKFGEIMTAANIGKKGIGHTQTFISIGAFDTLNEAKNLQKYLMCKFTRALLYILKVTQDNKKSVWKYVPQQNFTIKSDIDWSKSIKEIDQQLYKKYKLNKKEINFIETNVKEMV